jgi:hypothetical protein
LGDWPAGDSTVGAAAAFTLRALATMLLFLTLLMPALLFFMFPAQSLY